MFSEPSSDRERTHAGSTSSNMEASYNAEDRDPHENARSYSQQLTTGSTNEMPAFDQTSGHPERLKRSNSDLFPRERVQS